jgi:hypothetical protein
LAAIAALALVVAVVVATLVRVISDPLRVGVELLLFVAFLAAGWFALTRTGARRVIAVVVAVAVVVAFIVAVAGGEGHPLVSLAGRIAGSWSPWRSRSTHLVPRCVLSRRARPPAHPCGRLLVACCS